MHNNREFTSEYVFQEFPKWVTLADGSMLLVNSAEEEAVVIGPKEPKQEGDATAQADKAALLEQARALGLDPHANTGVEKLKQLISEAKS
ncbi:hypothetical protein [Cupriavidus basilensis]|uniref:hypothetical protein n=1 Tax=Cupriavidus basilensis TaxID=68895 RepID=UPI000751046A|nr:hypothetical protein [Cupriavidus basilensis]